MVLIFLIFVVDHAHCLNVAVDCIRINVSKFFKLTAILKLLERTLLIVTQYAV